MPVISLSTHAWRKGLKRPQQEAGHLQSKEKPHERATLPAPGSGASSLHKCEKVSVCHLIHPVCDLLRLPKQTHGPPGHHTILQDAFTLQKSETISKNGGGASILQELGFGLLLPTPWQLRRWQTAGARHAGSQAGCLDYKAGSCPLVPPTWLSFSVLLVSKTDGGNHSAYLTWMLGIH